MLEIWLPNVYRRLEALARLCGARMCLGAFIEDKNFGTILLQQAGRRGELVTAIESGLTAMGKDERAINVSGYVFQGKVEYSEHAFNKTSEYKGHERNHLMEQIEKFRVGDKKNRRDDDPLDTFCYGIAISLGNRDGF